MTWTQIKFHFVTAMWRGLTLCGVLMAWMKVDDWGWF